MEASLFLLHNRYRRFQCLQSPDGDMFCHWDGSKERQRSRCDRIIDTVVISNDITNVPLNLFNLHQMPSQLSTALKEQLKKIENRSEFNGSLPKIHSSSGKSYYVKEGSGSDAEQWTGEMESLKAIEAAAPGLVPHVYAHGTLGNGRPFMISEYKDLKHLTTSGALELAKRMATEVHQLKSLHGFGFEVPTYCGATRFENGWHSTWEKCYSSMYQHLVDSIRKKGGYNSLCDAGDRVVKEYVPTVDVSK